jgi:hypothetical protein
VIGNPLAPQAIGIEGGSERSENRCASGREVIAYSIEVAGDFTIRLQRLEHAERGNDEVEGFFELYARDVSLTKLGAGRRKSLLGQFATADGKHGF